MKQPSLFLCHIISIIFFFSSIINAVDMLQLSQTHALGDISYGLPVYDQDGFAPGTLVQTISGYQYIDDLAEADDVIDEYGQERRIVRTTKKLVDWYLELGIADSIICVGPDQQFYLLPENSWVKARELKVGDFLQGVDARYYPIQSITVVNDSAMVHALTIEDHVFCVDPGLLAHNAEAVLGISTMIVGTIVAINPTVAILGTACIISSITYLAYEKYSMQFLVDADDVSSMPLPSEVVLAERYYYQQRKDALNKLKRDFIQIKNDVCAIKGFCHTSERFSHQLLQYEIKKHTQAVVLKLSAADEIRLSETRRGELTGLREHELESLEKEIIELELLLALHCNELIEQAQLACREYDTVRDQVVDVVFQWNIHLDEITETIASRSYSNLLLQECLNDIIVQKIHTLQSIARYYRGCSHIKKCTNIVEIFDKLTPWMLQREQLAHEELRYIHGNIVIAEKYLIEHGVSVPHFKGEVKNVLEKQSKKSESEALKKAESRKSSIKKSSGPNKNDDDDKNKSKKIGISKDDIPHMFVDRPGHLPDTPENRKLLIDLASNIKNCLGCDKYGTEWYAKIITNGKQIWAVVRNGLIRNGGINEIPRAFNIVTGLSQLLKIKK